MKKIPASFVKFILVGGSAAIVEYVSFLLLNLFFMPLISNSLSFFCGLTVSFVLNKYWVFSSNGKVTKQLPSYVLLAVVNLMIGNVMIWILWQFLGTDILLAKLIVMAVIALWNYFLFSRIIFKNTLP